MEYDIMKIRSLCDRYFDGETTAEEELVLKEYFAHVREIPEDLKAVKAMMCGFTDAASMTYSPTVIRHKSIIGKVIWGTVAAAASVAVIFSFRNKEIYGYQTNGKAITDPVAALDGVAYLSYLEKFETTIDMAEMFADEIENNN